MHTTPEERALGNYEFQFVSTLAKDIDGQDSENGSTGLSALNALGAEGWEIRAVTVDPRLPAAKLLIALQRQVR